MINIKYGLQHLQKHEKNQHTLAAAVALVTKPVALGKAAQIPQKG